MFEKEGRICDWYYLAIACLLTVLSFGVVINDSMAAGPGGYALKFPEDPNPNNPVQERDIQYVRINFGEDRLRYDARSVSLWFKTEGVGHRCLVAYINSTGKITGPYIGLQGGQIWVTDWGAISLYVVWEAHSDKLSFNDNKWHHLVHVFGKQRHTAEPEKNIVKHRVYVDGERLIFNYDFGMGGQPVVTQEGVDEFDGNSTTVNADAMTLGYTPFGKPCIWTNQRQSGWHFYDSFIDDVAVWETALTDDEVRELYGGTSPTSPAMSDPRGYLRGYWPFVRGSGETVEDVAGISMSPPSSFLPLDEEHRIEWVRPIPKFEPADSVSFGEVFLPSTCDGDPQDDISATLTIRNTGYAALRILGVVREGPVLGHSNYAYMDIEPANSDVIELPFDYDAWVGAAAETRHGTYDETLTITTNQAELYGTNDYRVTEKVEVARDIELYFAVLSPSKLEHDSPEKQDGQVHVAFGDTVEFKVEYIQCYENEEIERLEYKLVEQGGEVVIDWNESEIDDENLPLLAFEISFTEDNELAKPNEYSEYNLEVRIFNDLGCPTVPDEYTEIRVWERPGEPQAVHDPDNVDWYDSGEYFFGEKGKAVRLRAEVPPEELHGNTIEEYEWEMVEKKPGEEVKEPLFTAVPGSVESFVFDDDNIMPSEDGKIWLRCTAISKYGIESEPSELGDFELRLRPNLQVDACGPYKGIPGRDVELQAAIINTDEYGKGFQQGYQWKVSDEPGIKFSEGVLVKIDDFPISPATTQMTIAFWMKCPPQDTTLADWSVDNFSVFSMEMVDSDIAINFNIDNKALKIEDLSVDDNTWHHIALTWQAADDKLRLYKDGKYEKEATLEVSTEVQELVSQLVIGGDYDGYLDDFSIWNRVLENEKGKDEIAKLMQGKMDTWSELVGYWKFDEGEGTTVRDYSGSENDAEILCDDPSAVWPARRDVQTTRDGRAYHSWFGRDAVYVVECAAWGETVEDLDVNGSALTTVEIKGGYPVARIGGPYLCGIAGGDFSPIQFEGNLPTQKDLDTEGNEVQIDTWIWRFNKTLSHNEGIRFDGSDYVEVGSFDLGEIQSQLSLSAWFDTEYEGGIVVSDVYSLGVENGDLVFEFGNGTETCSVSTADPQDETDFSINDNRWHHAAGVYDGLEMRLYVDGILRSSAPASGDIPISTQVHMGEGFRGCIDEVTVWDKAIAKWHIDMLRCGRVPTDRSGLLGYWSFHEGIGAVTRNNVTNEEDDLSGNPQWVEPEIITVEDQWNPEQEYEMPGKYSVMLQVGTGKEPGKVRWSNVEETTVTVIDGSISGTIRAADLRTPVGKVRLTLTSPGVLDGDLSSLVRVSNDLEEDNNGGVYTYTDVEGSYLFQDLPLGTYIIVPSKTEANGTIHKFEKPKEAVELTLRASDRPAVDFVDHSVFPVGGLIRARKYDLEEVSDILIPDVVVEAIPLASTSSIRSTPSELTATIDRNYTIPLFVGDYVFFAGLGGRDIRLDLDHLDAEGIPYEQIDPDNPAAGGIINVRAPTSDICFRDETRRELKVSVEDPGGFPVMYLDDEPIAATVARSGGGKATKAVEEENGRAVITYELPPAEYTLKVADDFLDKGITFRHPDDPEVLESDLVLDLTVADAEVTMVVPATIQLAFGPRPKLFGGPIQGDFRLALREDPFNLTDQQIDDLEKFQEGYMFYWPTAPQRHTYAIRATANDRPLEGYTLIVTDDVSQMTVDAATSQRISIPLLLKTAEDKYVGPCKAELEGLEEGDKLPEMSMVRDLFDVKGSINLSDDAFVREASLDEVPGWIITDLEDEAITTYYLRVETVDGNETLYADQGTYTVLGGLPWMDEQTKVKKKYVKFQAKKNAGYLPSEEKSDGVRVLGDRAKGTAPELIAVPEINYLVLHDPPGDCSYAFIDDSLTVKVSIGNMRISAVDGTTIPVYPSPWSDERGFTQSLGIAPIDRWIIPPTDYAREAGDKFEGESLGKGIPGTAAAVAAGGLGPAGFAAASALFDLEAESIGSPITQYSIRPNRKLETSPSEELLEQTSVFPDLVGPGRGDIYFGEGITIGLQPKWRLGMKYENGQWVPETDEITTYEILHRENQYVYTARDIEKIIESLYKAEEAQEDVSKKKDIREKRQKWAGHLEENPAYVWSEFYVENETKYKKLDDKQNAGEELSSFEKYQFGHFKIAKDKIASKKGNAFEAFREAMGLPGDDSDGVETLIFAGGTSFEYSRTISEDAIVRYTEEATITTSANMSGQMDFGWEVEPDEWNPVLLQNYLQTGASVSFATSIQIQRGFESGQALEQRVGFVLQDDDVGDSITTRVYEDPIYGTPLFIHDPGSVTSDPWEPGTNKGIDITMTEIPSRLDFRFSTGFDQGDIDDLDGNIFPDSLADAFEDKGISLPEPYVEVDEAGSRWYIKDSTVEVEYAVHLESNGTEMLNVYEVVRGTFDYHSGAHYKVRLFYNGERDLESDFSTFDFTLYAPQTENRDSLTVRFNGQNGAYETYKVGLTKEAPAANISISVYPPEVDQGNSYEKQYSAIILAQEVKDAQINRQIALKPRFADLRAPQAEIISPYQGQRIGPAMVAGPNNSVFEVQAISRDTDMSEIRIWCRSKRPDGVWGEEYTSENWVWKEGNTDNLMTLEGDPPYNRYTFKWTSSDIPGEGEYQIFATATDKAGNKDLDPPKVDFIVDATKPDVLTTIPNYQFKDSERIYRGELSVTFTDDMRASDFTWNSFYVQDLLEDIHVTGYISYSPALRKALFVPEVPLRLNGLYKVIIRTDSDEAEGIHDLAGNPLKRDFSWTFRTTDALLEPTWSITLKAINTDGQENVLEVDANNMAGVEYGALDGEDEKDARSVPPIDTQMSLSFLNEYKEKFDRDIRPADGRLSHHWFFVVGNAKEGKVIIRYSTSDNLADNVPPYKIRLVGFEIDDSGNVMEEIPIPPLVPEEGKEQEAYSYDVYQDGDTRYFRLDMQNTNCGTFLVAARFQVGTSGWKFFSVPIKPVPEEPFVNLGDDIDPFQMYEYVYEKDEEDESEPDTKTGRYKIYPLDLGEVTLQTGHGYFTRLNCDVEVDVGGSYNMNDVTLPVLEVKGWHAIGNPFPKAVDAATLKVNGHWFGTSSANDLVEGTLYRWKTDGSGDTYEAVDQFSQLLPWEGYWIKTKEDDVTLTIPAPSGLDDAYNILPDSYKPPVMAPPAGDSRRIAVQPGEFSLRLALTSSSSADTTTILGARQKARIDWDPMDQSEPPILGETVAAYFHHPDWGDDSGSYNRDYQPVLSVGDERTWRVTVYTDKPDSQMKLSWEESISQVPDDVMLYFRRADTGADDDWRDMRKVRSMDLESRLQFTSIPIEIRAQRYEMRPPSGVQVTPGEKLVILRWEPDDNEFIEGYIITRQNGSAEDWRDGEGVSYTINNVSEFVDRKVLEEVTYTYQLRVRFMSGAELGSQLFTVRTLPIIKQTALMRCYPNPFNPEVWIPYDLAEEAWVSVEIYSVSGQLVRTLDLGVQQRGRYASREKAAHWDGLNQSGEKSASGVYFYVLRAGKFRESKKMVLIR